MSTVTSTVIVRCFKHSKWIASCGDCTAQRIPMPRKAA